MWHLLLKYVLLLSEVALDNSKHKIFDLVVT